MPLEARVLLERPSLTTPMMSQSLRECLPLRRAAVASFVMLLMLQDRCVQEQRRELASVALGNRRRLVLRLCVLSHAFAVPVLVGVCRH